jgi:hypothetical protein
VTEDFEKVIEPRRIIKIFASVFLIIFLLLTTIFGTKMAYTALNRAEQATHDHTWFSETHDQIQALQIPILETRTSFKAHQEQASSRWISRQDDRLQSQRLTALLLRLTEEHTQLVQEYNASAAEVNTEALGELPRHIDLIEKED